MNDNRGETFGLDDQALSNITSGKTELKRTSSEHLRFVAGENPVGVNIDKLVESLSKHGDGFSNEDISTMVATYSRINQDIQEKAATEPLTAAEESALEETYLDLITKMRLKIRELQTDPMKKVNALDPKLLAMQTDLNRIMALAVQNTTKSQGFYDLRSREAVQAKVQNPRPQQ